MSYVYPKVGAFFNDETNETKFTVWAPLKKNIEIVIDGQPPLAMQRDEFGFCSVTHHQARPGSHYYYKIDADKLLPDPASRHQPDGVHKASAVVDNTFPWTDHSWKGVPLANMVIYELHVGTFTKQGTFDGVVSKLDYLKDLGINAIELMPLAQFPGTRNWGYDGVFPFAVQHSYGGVAGLKNLVNEAHKRGIAVILDVVYNHQGPEGNYFNEYGPYFSDKYKTFWGSAINYDNAYCDGVRHFYWQNALMWLEEFRIDGLRMDAVHAIWDFSASHFIQDLVQQVKDIQEQTGREKVLIAEIDLNNPRYITAPAKGGYGMDGQWIDEFHHALHALITKEVDGYYEDFGSVHDLAKALKYSYVYTGEYSVHRKKQFGVLPKDNPYSQFVVFAQNHDQVGNRMLGDRLSTQLSLEALKLVAATILLAPQVPMLFMGEEYGEKNPFQYFISHTDTALVEAVRKGRKEEFDYFKWEGEVPDPQSEETFQQCILSWRIDNNSMNGKLLNLYKHLIQLRKTHPAFQGRTSQSINVYDPGETKIISFDRTHKASNVLVVLNFDESVLPFTLPGNATALTKIFDSSALEWGGPGELTESSASSMKTILLHPHSAIVFQY